MKLSLRRVTSSLCAALLAAGSVAAQVRVQLTDEMFPGAVDAPHESFVLARVVDDLTGRPIAGADVFFVKEAAAPIAGEFWFTRKVRTDADGFLRAPVGDIRDEWHMQVLRHPAVGVAARHGVGDHVWRVGRPFDVPVRVVDWRGAPVANAPIGFCCGCGHTPDLVNAVTGADGVAVLKGVDPHSDIGDVYVQRAGVGLGYDSVRWNPGESPAIVRGRWSPALTGRVVDHLGEPVAGAFVAALDVHRGPWARTGADGAFTLLGAKREIGASHVLLADGRKVWFAEPERYPVTLHLPDPAGDDPYEGTITNGDEAFVAPKTRKLTIELVGADDLMASVDWPGAPERRSRDDEVLEVPQTGPMVIYVWATQGARGRPFARYHYFADASALPAEPLRLGWFEPVEVRGRFVDERGRPAAARVYVRDDWRERAAPEFPTEEPSATFALRTRRSGKTLLEVVPDDARLRSRLVWVVLPERGAEARVDVGAIALSPTPQLRVLAADGEALAGASVRWARAGHQEAGAWRSFALDGSCAFVGPDLAAGDALSVRVTENAVPHRVVLDGDGPWTVTPPDGRIRLRVTDEQGAEVEATVVIGDHDRRVRNDEVLRGLPHGEVRLFVASPGRRGAIVDVDVPARGEPALDVDVTLPSR